MAGPVRRSFQDGWSGADQCFTTVLILVDPRNTRFHLRKGQGQNVRESPTRTRMLSDEDLDIPSAFQAVPSSPGVRVPGQLNNCVFYDAYSVNGDAIKRCVDPFDATIILRNLIFASWDNSIHRLYVSGLTAWRLKEEIWASDEFVKGIEELRDTMNLDELHYMNVSSGLRLVLELRQSLRELKHCFLTTDVEDQDIFEQSDVAKPSNTPAESQPQMQTTLESRRWGVIDDRLQAVENTVRSVLESFSKRTELQHSFQSNQQARDSSLQARSGAQLTKIATVAVPFSIVSAIFSMGGDYAAGERLFFVYWAIALPISALLLLWILVSAWLSRVWDPIELKIKMAIKLKYRAFLVKLLQKEQDPIM